METEMKVEEALSLLDQVCAAAKLNREEHTILRQAIEVIKAATIAQPAEAAKQ
jgi:hypothetical protein